ncbi:eCIS core domain-containing protein [Pareuzebyella sediminis]|uniref:eCIS core domain-containing protein n=1 Tax=Pareuzebyella sediminis TaxID=2607998 RepID=UPI0011EC9DAF|nr:DUF4157 domain-containing protein [Pareuzebyella sediminis]
MKNKASRRQRSKKQKPAQKKTQNEHFFEAQVQRKCEKCEDEEKKGVQKKADGQSASKSSSFFGHYMNTISSKGSHLSKKQRSFFEPRMQDNFGDVKLHADKEAGNAAKEIGAKAFTWQNHIVLNKASIAGDSLEVQQVLAHELKHVQQQKNGKHVIQMMPEDEAAASIKEEETDQATKENEKEQGTTKDSVAMEKEAELEKDRIMAPEIVPDVQYSGRPTTKTVFGNTVSFQGVTTANFNGGNGRSTSLERTPVPEGPGCTENDCWHYTGNYVIDYSVSTSVTLPSVPSGLTDCQQERVRDAIANELAPHEQEHVAAFNQYNGSVTLTIDYTGPSAGIEAHVQHMHDAHEQARMAAANAESAALDPFHVEVDLECEDSPAVIPDSAPEE